MHCWFFVLCLWILYVDNICICTILIFLMMHHLAGVDNLVISGYFFNQNFLCSIEELQRLLKDKEAYNAFFNSLDQVKTQNNVSSVAQPLLYICDAGFTRGCWNPFCIITHILMACLERRNEKHRKGKAIGIGKKCSGKTDDWNTQFFYELEFGIQE